MSGGALPSASAAPSPLPGIALECEEHLRFEMDAVADLARGRQGLRWLDVWCGPGTLLRETPGEMRRIGVDGSETALRAARYRHGHPAAFVRRDGCDLSGLGRHDLVTCFRFGFVLADAAAALDLVRRTADAVAPGGDLLLGACNPGRMFDLLPRDLGMHREPDVSIDGLVWSFGQAGAAGLAERVAIHPGLVRDALKREFASCEREPYPEPHGAPHLRRTLIRLKGRRADGDRP